MKNTFDRQLKPQTRNDLSPGLSPVATGNVSPLVLRVICDKSAPDRVPEHETPEAFLRALMAYEDNEASLRLRNGLAKVEREKKFIRNALFLMVMFFALSLAGLGYCAILRPRIFSDSTNFVTRGLSILFLASLISQVEVFGYQLWQRSAVNRLHKECRRRVLVLVGSQLNASPRRNLSVDICREPGTTVGGMPVQQAGRASPEPPSS